MRVSFTATFTGCVMTLVYDLLIAETFFAKGNILVDDNGNVQLTDFGMGLLADATPYNYASKHGGGAFQFRGPELHDPESFELDDDRPTTASDMYSLALVAVEVMQYAGSLFLQTYSF